MIADGLAELQVRWPHVPIVFCETRPWPRNGPTATSRVCGLEDRSPRGIRSRAYLQRFWTVICLVGAFLPYPVLGADQPDGRHQPDPTDEVAQRRPTQRTQPVQVTERRAGVSPANMNSESSTE